MPNYIDAELLESKYREGTDPQDPYSEITYLLPEDVENIPTADFEPVDRWISVKDRLPEDNGKYMVWYEGEWDICEFDVESQTFGYTYDDYDEMYSHLVCWDDSINKKVTHWQPLPEPPKEVQDDDS